MTGKAHVCKTSAAPCFTCMVGKERAKSGHHYPRYARVAGLHQTAGYDDCARVTATVSADCTRMDARHRDSSNHADGAKIAAAPRSSLVVRKRRQTQASRPGAGGHGRRRAAQRKQRAPAGCCGHKSGPAHGCRERQAQHEHEPSTHVPRPGQQGEISKRSANSARTRPFADTRELQIPGLQ